MTTTVTPTVDSDLVVTELCRYTKMAQLNLNFICFLLLTIFGLSSGAPVEDTNIPGDARLFFTPDKLVQFLQQMFG